MAVVEQSSLTEGESGRLLPVDNSGCYVSLSAGTINVPVYTRFRNNNSNNI